MRYVCAVLMLLSAFNPIVVRSAKSEYTIRFYDWTHGCVRTTRAEWYTGGNLTELGVGKIMVFRNTIQTRDTMTTSTMWRDVWVKAGFGGLLNVAVICRNDMPVPAGVTARLTNGVEHMDIPLSGEPRRPGVVVYAVPIPIFPAAEDAVYTITLSTEHMGVSYLPEDTPQYRIDLQLQVTVVSF